MTLTVAMLVIPFIPASNVFFRVGFVIAERVLYLPVAGFCVLVILGATRLCQKTWSRHVSTRFPDAMHLTSPLHKLVSAQAQTWSGVLKITIRNAI